MLTQTIEEEILRAISSALSTKTFDTIQETSSSDLEGLVANESVDTDSTDLPEKEFKINVTEVMDYSKLVQDFHFEQVHYAALESEYLPKAAAEHETKYKEWEDNATVYAMEESATMDELEAEDTIQEVIYSTVLGGSEVSFEKKQRLDTWIKFNHTLFTLYKSMASVRSNDVNYGVH